MKKLLEFVKVNKTVLIIILLIFTLVLAVVIMNGLNGGETETSNTSSEQTSTEKKLSEILSSIAGVGDTQVMINEDDGGINGVIIVCTGANNIMTRNNIINAVSTALNIEKNIIAIYAMN